MSPGFLLFAQCRDELVTWSTSPTPFNNPAVPNFFGTRDPCSYENLMPALAWRGRGEGTATANTDEALRALQFPWPRG